MALDGSFIKGANKFIKKFIRKVYMQYEEFCKSKIIKNEQIDQNHNGSTVNNLKYLIGEMKYELNNIILDSECNLITSAELLNFSRILDELIVEFIKMENNN